MINKIILCGNVGKDPKITTFEDGGSVAQFSFATTEKGFKTKEGKDIPDRTEWHNIVVNRKGLAGMVGQYVHKGDKLMIVGKLRYRNYDDENGVTRTIAEIYAEEIELSSKPVQAAAPAPAPAQPEDDDLPWDR